MITWTYWLRLLAPDSHRGGKLVTPMVASINSGLVDVKATYHPGVREIDESAREQQSERGSGSQYG